MSNTSMDTSILDVIKSGIMPFTAKEVEEKVHLGHYGGALVENFEV